jgi:gamma-glutamylcyclotransferase (GGCT)/AIG2-like uncharacterized protein YtfP
MRKNSLVFVYGTLRKGEVNDYLLNCARYRGDYTTDPCYKMVNLGGYPGVVKRGRTRIAGEVYDVNAETMAALDRLEGYPSDYTRELIVTPWGRAWIYIYRGSLKDRAPIVSGVWRETIKRRRWSR